MALDVLSFNGKLPVIKCMYCRQDMSVPKVIIELLNGFISILQSPFLEKKVAKESFMLIPNVWNRFSLSCRIGGRNNEYLTLL